MPWSSTVYQPMSELSVRTIPESHARAPPALKKVAGLPGWGLGSTRPAPARLLDPEQSLDLIPDRQAQDRGEEEEHADEAPEAHARPCDLRLMLLAGATLGALLREGARDCVRIHGRHLDIGTSRGRSGHGGAILAQIRRLSSSAIPAAAPAGRVSP